MRLLLLLRKIVRSSARMLITTVKGLGMCVRSHSLCIAGLKAGPTVGEYFGWSCGARAGSNRRAFIALSIERVSRIIKLPWSSYFSCGAMVQRLARGPFKDTNAFPHLG